MELSFVFLISGVIFIGFFGSLSHNELGLASAVLAALPVAAGIKGSEGFIKYTFIVIVITNALMTAGVFITEGSAAAATGG